MKRALVLPVLLALAACGQSSEDRFAAARAAFAAEDFTAARLSLISALREAPDDRAMLELLVQSQLRMGDGDGAQGTVSRLRRLGLSGAQIERYEAEAELYRGLARQALERLAADNSPEAWRLRAAAQLDLGKSDLALDAFRQGMAAGRDYRLAHDYARFLLSARDLDGVDGVLATLRQLGPQALGTAMVEGELAAVRGNHAAAIAIYRKAAERFPARIEPLLAEALSQDGLGKIDLAIAATEAAARKAPDDARVHSLQVQFAAMKGDWAKVRTVLQPREAVLAPLSGDGLTYAEALLRLGQAEQARALFAKAHALAPTNPFARLMLAEAQLATGDARSAFETIRPLAESAMADQRELEIAATAAEKAGYPEGAGLRARLASAQLKAARALAERGQTALARGDWGGAIAAYGEMAAANDRDAEVFKRLAFALSHAARHDEAVAAADKALALAPEDPDMIHMAGLARLRGGRDGARALALLEEAARKLPGNLEFRSNLEKARAAAG